MNNASLKRILDAGYGMLCGPSRTGLMVGTDAKSCPPGWLFIPSEVLNEKLLLEAWEIVKSGRDNWPKNKKSNTKSIKNMTDEERRNWYFQTLRNDEYFGEVPEITQ